MRIGLLSVKQSVYDTPTRFVSKSKAKRLIRQLTHEKISKCLIRELVVGATPSSNPERHYTPHLEVVKVSKPLPPALPSTLNLFYPVADQSSFRDRNFKEVWACDQDEWQRRIGAT